MIQTRSRILVATLAAVFVLGVASTSFAGTIRDGKSWGIGINGGYGGGNGVSFKTFLGSTFALQAYAGGHGSDWSPHVGADLLFEGGVLGGGSVLDVAWNVGGGAATTLNSDADVWLHAVGGIELLFKPVPIDVVFELRPTFGFRSSNKKVNAGGGVHARWWF